MSHATRIGVEAGHTDLLNLQVDFGERGRVFTGLDMSPDTLIILGSQNKSRIGTMRRYMPLNRVIGVPVDPEPLLKDTRRVSLHKLGEANELVPHTWGTSVVTATDALTEILTIGSEGNAEYQIVGQPESLLTTLSTNFFNMYHISTTNGIPSEYRVRTHSFLLHRNDKMMLFEDGQVIQVALNPLVAQHLATNKGLIDYFSAFQTIYGDLLNPKFKLDKISGGIDLLFLVYMGAVDKINDIFRNDPQFEKELTFATFIVTVGFSPKILRLLGIPKEEIIPQGSFIHLIVYRALQSLKESMNKYV